MNFSEVQKLNYSVTNKVKASENRCNAVIYFFFLDFISVTSFFLFVKQI